MTDSVSRINREIRFPSSLCRPKRKRQEPLACPAKKAKSSPLEGVVPLHIQREAPHHFARYEELVRVIQKVLDNRHVHTSLHASCGIKIRLIFVRNRSHVDRLAELGALAYLLDTLASPKSVLDSQKSCFDLLHESLFELLRGYKQHRQLAPKSLPKKQMPSLYRYTVLEEFSKILFLSRGEFNPCGAALIQKLLRKSSVAAFVKEDHYDHLLKLLENLSSLPSVSAQKVDIAVAMDAYVRSILMKGEEGDLTHVDLSRAVLISLMSRYRQVHGGICYAIASLREGIHNNPVAMYHWVLNLYTTGEVEISGGRVEMAPVIEMSVIKDQAEPLCFKQSYGTLPFIQAILDRHNLEKDHKISELSNILPTQSAQDHFFHHLNGITTLPVVVASILSGVNTGPGCDLGSSHKSDFITAVSQLIIKTEGVSEEKEPELFEKLHHSLVFFDSLSGISGEVETGKILMHSGPFLGSYSAEVKNPDELLNVFKQPRLIFFRVGSTLTWCKTLRDLTQAIKSTLDFLPQSRFSSLSDQLINIMIETSDTMPKDWAPFLKSHDLCLVQQGGAGVLSLPQNIAINRKPFVMDGDHSVPQWLDYIEAESQQLDEPRSTILTKIDGHAFTFESKALSHLKNRYTKLRKQSLKVLKYEQKMRTIKSFFRYFDVTQSKGWIARLKKEERSKTFKEAASLIMHEDQHKKRLSQSLFEVVGTCSLTKPVIESVLHAVCRKNHPIVFREIAKKVFRHFGGEPKYPHVFAHKIRKWMIHFQLPPVPTRILTDKITYYSGAAPIHYMGDTNWVDDDEAAALSVAMSYDFVSNQPVFVFPSKAGMSFDRIDINKIPKVYL